MPSKFSRIYTLYTTILISVILLAYSSNPPNGRTNAPGDGYCEDCHLPGNPLGLDGELTIENFPSTIDPNTDYTITVRVTNPNGLAFKAGFQAVVLDGSDQNIGDLIATGTNPSTTTTGSREYVEHTPAINFPASNEVTWDFIWTSPNGPDAEVITLYAAGNIANGGAGNANDLIRSTNVSGTLIGGSSLTVSILFSSNVSCEGGEDGSATALAIDGESPYSYMWPNGTTGATVNNLSAGDHTVTVTDDVGATATATVSISEPAPIFTTVTSSIINCINNTATATANVSGGTSGYSYLWPSGGTDQTETGLTSGSYTITVTDANACSDTETFTIDEDFDFPTSSCAPPDNLTCSTSTVVLDGTASSSGINITYLWSTINGNIIDGQGTTTALVDQAGDYTLTVSNNENGCSSQSTVTVVEAAALELMSTATDVSCNGENNGSIDLTVTGGIAPFDYVWDVSSLNGQEDPTGLSAGTYCVTVTDDDDCTASICTTVSSPSAITITGSILNASCNGLCDGVIDVSASGGVGIYTYQWNTTPIQTTPIVTGLCPGTYTVIVTDANGCTAEATYTIAQPSELGVEGIATAVSCNGLCDGIIQTAVVGGMSPYAYLWSTGSTDEELTGVCAGEYTFTVTDNNGCTASFPSITVEEPEAISITSNSVQNTCFDSCEGEIDISVSGGVGPYIYLWNTNPPQDVQDPSGLCPGTYTVVVTDANDCTAEASFDIDEYNALIIDFAETDASCIGFCDGGITPTISGGTAPFTFSWSNGSNLCDIINECPGTYTVTVTDANGCTGIQTGTITEPDAIAISGEVSNVCSGACNGSITVNASGGTGTFTYEWNTIPAQITQTATDLCAGTYTVTVTDENGCTSNASFSVTEFPAIVIGYNVTTPTCNGSCDGDIMPFISGGAPPYSFQWSNGSTACDIQDICAGQYSITVTDAEGCTESAVMDVGEPLVIEITSTYTNTSCEGTCDATIDLTVEGGTGDFIYEWDLSVNTEDLVGLCAGTYTVIVTDENGCTESHSVNITSPSGLTIDYQVIEPTCNGICDGSATLEVTGGTEPYTYLWDNGSTDESFQNLCAGFPTVTVTDANGCSSQITFEVLEPSAIEITAFSTESTCGFCNGSIDATVIGGTAPYSFSWSNTQDTEDLDNLCAGIYSLTVTDANSCTATYSIDVNLADGPSISGSVTDVSCNGSCDGSIDLTISGGTEPFDFDWGDALSNTEDLSNLCPGTYSVIVTDANACSITASFTVLEPNQLMADLSATAVSCTGECDGNIAMVVTGGTGPFTFSWSNGSTQCDLPEACAGTYTVTVTDANGCTLIATETINEPPPIVLNITTTDASPGASDGTASVIASGGTSTFIFYEWDDPTNQTLPTATNLVSGTYCVIVTDSNGCTAEGCAIVGEGSCTLSGNLSIFDVSCSGQNDGALTANVTGGVEPFDYNWSNGGNEMSNAGLIAGSYSVTTTDATGCSIVLQAIVSEPDPILISANITDVSCFGACDGMVDLFISGGTQPYTYDWSGPCVGPNPVDICAGTFTVIVTDANNCTATSTVTITQPSPIVLDMSSTAVSAPGAMDGTATVEASGGTSTFIFYEWNDPTNQTLPTATNLVSGTYCVIVTDSNGCTAEGCAIVSEGSCTLSGNLSIFDVSCSGQNDGALTANVTGGVEPFDYNWSNGGNEMSNAGLIAGSYSVTTTDATGCSIVLQAIVSEPDPILISANITDVSCFGACDGMVDLFISGGTQPYTYDWSGPCVGPNPVDICAGTFTVIVTDANNCTATSTVTITQPSPIVLDMSSTAVSAPGAMDGTATVEASGGTPGYTEAWSNGEVGQTTINNLAPGDYCVTITDSENCSETNCVTVFSSGCMMTLEVNSTTPTCFGECTGSIDITNNNGMAPITYSWAGGVIGDIEDPTNLCPGNYSVTATDANGCTATIDANIAENPQISVNLLYIVAPCTEVCTGMIDATIEGGTPPYAFLWSNGETTEDIFDLCKGDYFLTVTDAMGCTETDFELIEDITPGLNVEPAVMNANCFDSCDGAAVVDVSGGTVPLDFDWEIDEYDGESTVSDLCAGDYLLTITDAVGCTNATVFAVESPTEILTESITTDACFGECNGTVTASPIGGSGSYSTDWGGLDPNELCPGDYSYTITDSNGCADVVNFTIAENPEITYTIDMVVNETEGQANGMIDISVTSGNMPVSFTWYLDDPVEPQVVSNDEDPANLPAGVYYCFITDTTGCFIPTTQITIDNIVNVLETAWENQIKVFPNPVNDILYIQYDLNESLDVVLEVFDIRGVKVLEQHSITSNMENDALDLENLANGVYTLRISSEESFYSYKIVRIGK